jgi:hypothetical protein
MSPPRPVSYARNAFRGHSKSDTGHEGDGKGVTFCRGSRRDDFDIAIDELGNLRFPATEPFGTHSSSASDPI